MTRHYVPMRKCAPRFWGWLFVCKRQFGGTALHLRICGFDSYGLRMFGYR